VRAISAKDKRIKIIDMRNRESEYEYIVEVGYASRDQSSDRVATIHVKPNRNILQIMRGSKVLSEFATNENMGDNTKLYFNCSASVCKETRTRYNKTLRTVRENNDAFTKPSLKELGEVCQLMNMPESVVWEDCCKDSIAILDPIVKYCDNHANSIAPKAVPENTETWSVFVSSNIYDALYDGAITKFAIPAKSDNNAIKWRDLVYIYSSFERSGRSMTLGKVEGITLATDYTIFLQNLGTDVGGYQKTFKSREKALDDFETTYSCSSSIDVICVSVSIIA
jgi:hypothetical protein